ncbi:MAG TPA: nucleotide exchange factor GrpE [Candidatus Saccharimonadales bacterium]|nr:nucleotide exchange factor GrpE [Candidatus Saccharimonadales bacterium]
MPKTKSALPKDDNINKLEQQVNELTDALKRERADAINMRRRHDEDLAGLRIRVKANVVRDLLPAIDNLERALNHTPQELEGNPYVKGVEAVVKQFAKSLTDIGVERIKTVGEPFDPRFHEAVSVEEGEGAKEVVSEELQSGYKIGDEVIRHAMVRVKT